MSRTVARAEAILRGACGDRVRTDVVLAPFTTFRIGGPAALFLEVESESELAAAGEAIRETSVPFVLLGKGSNLLVSDEGFPGLVLRLGRGYRWATRDGDRLTAGGAMPLPALAGLALSHALTGLEFGVAIPATVGGAVRMNAGAHGHEISGVVETIEVFELLSGATHPVAAAEAGFRYRRSALPGDGVIVGVGFGLSPSATAEIRERMDQAREWRRRTQPLAEPNCGSVFKNPPGDHAARLIEAAGGKGVAVGGVAVSEKHANFIVASEDARASDVVQVIRVLQDLVAARFDILLEPEVHLVGDFALAPR